jgi:hypothetical protein
MKRPQGVPNTPGVYQEDVSKELRAYGQVLFYQLD